MFRVLLIALVWGFSFFSFAEMADISKISESVRFPVEKYKLDNGLTVILHEDHSAPIISYHQWYRVGSRNEKVGRTGLAHFFEHLMFKGTKKYPREKYERVIQANGGSNNAFTSHDYTGYYTNLPSGKLELAIDIESDRLHKLIIEEAAVKSEREVVKEERRTRVESSVFGSLFEALFRTSYKVHNYRWPVIGYMKDLNAASLEDLKEFYRIYYAPNNSVVVIAGSFDSAKAKKWLQKYYGEIPAQKLPVQKISAEPIQQGQRETNVFKDVQSTTMAVAFAAPAAGSDDAYALDLLANIMGEGSSSRLYKRLVYKEQKVTSTSSWAYTLKDPGIFAVTASVKPGIGDASVLKSIYGEIYKARTNLVSDLELEKAKNQVMMGYVNSLKTVAGKARALALNEIYFSDYSEIFRDLERYASVTKEQVQTAAKKYLLPERRSIIRVRPKKAPKS